ncbi:MAG: trimethylamine methyltransferase [Chloroflexi bacterium]|nr:trimethylamine methyltransferase [Chloroflexota bacterium]
MENDQSAHPGPLHCHRLSDSQCERLYAGILEVLERTGVFLYEETAINLLKKAGAAVSDGNRVRIPGKLVEQALKTAPKEVTLYNRYGEAAMPVSGYTSYFGTGSDCLYVIDHRTDERRRAVVQDIEEGMRVADALDNVDFVMCMFMPWDVDEHMIDRYAMATMLKNTDKPIMYVTTDFSSIPDVVHMAELVVGGPRALEEKPIAACYVNVTTGLVHNEEALQKLLYLSGRGLPYAYVPSTQGGMTAPVTPIAALAVAQAGALAGLVLSQLNNEGSPFIMPGWGGNMLDMRTTVQPYADPDKRMLAADFVHWLGLPMFSLAGVSDAKIVDQQAGIEAALTLATDIMVGGNIVHDLGYLDSGLTGSLAQLVICNEILGWLKHLVQPVEINDETLPLDLIDQIGPDGHFIDTDHTFEHFRERWYPSLFERDNYEGWLGAGAKTLGERAVERVQHILDTHHPQPLPNDISKGIDAIIRQAEQQLSHAA